MVIMPLQRIFFAFITFVNMEKRYHDYMQVYTYSGTFKRMNTLLNNTSIYICIPRHKYLVCLRDFLRDSVLHNVMLMPLLKLIYYPIVICCNYIIYKTVLTITHLGILHFQCITFSSHLHRWE